MEHTKGPWHYTNRLVFEPNGICIAEAFSRGCAETPHPEANARLIAAAPDLLEACKKAFSVFACDATRRVTPDMSYSPACRMLQDAIAKAEE